MQSLQEARQARNSDVTRAFDRGMSSICDWPHALPILLGQIISCEWQAVRPPLDALQLLANAEHAGPALGPQLFRFDLGSPH